MTAECEKNCFSIESALVDRVVNRILMKWLADFGDLESAGKKCYQTLDAFELRTCRVN